MRFFTFLILLISSGFALAQELPSTVIPAPETASDSNEVELKVGDSMEIGICPGEHFIHLDYFRKTRWVGGEPAYDTATGNGFYQSFFTTGDFNALELPPEFSGRRFAILGMEVLVNKNTGEDMGVLYLRGPDPHSVIWVDFKEALEKSEIGLPGQVMLPR